MARSAGFDGLNVVVRCFGETAPAVFGDFIEGIIITSFVAKAKLTGGACDL